MTIESNLRNLEARLASAVAEVARAENDLNAALEKAGMRPVAPSHAKALFTLEIVAAALADKRIHDDGLRALLFPAVHIALAYGPEQDRERIEKCSNWLAVAIKYQRLDDEAAIAARATEKFETRQDPAVKRTVRAPRLTSREPAPSPAAKSPSCRRPARRPAGFWKPGPGAEMKT